MSITTMAGIAFLNSTLPPDKSILPGDQPITYTTNVVALLITTEGAVADALGPLTPAAIVDLQGSVLAAGSTQPPLAQSFSIPTLLVLLPEGKTSSPGGKSATMPYDLYLSAIEVQGRQVAILLVGRLHTEETTLNSLELGLLLAGPLTLLVAALGGHWLVSRAMRLVRLITRAAREISETDLSRRLNAKRQDELGEMGAMFDAMLSRLEAAFACQRQFTADASHELRTPLTIMGLEVIRTLAQPRTPEEYQRALATIQAEQSNMIRLVSDLLLLARADAGRAASA